MHLFPVPLRLFLLFCFEGKWPVIGLGSLLSAILEQEDMILGTGFPQFLLSLLKEVMQLRMLTKDANQESRTEGTQVGTQGARIT